MRVMFINKYKFAPVSTVFVYQIFAEYYATPYTYLTIQKTLAAFYLFKLNGFSSVDRVTAPPQ